MSQKLGDQWLTIIDGSTRRVKDTETVANEGDTVILNADHMDGMMELKQK